MNERLFMKLLGQFSVQGVVPQFPEAFVVDLKSILEMAIEYDTDYWAWESEDGTIENEDNLLLNNHSFTDEILEAIEGSVVLQQSEKLADEIEDLMSMLSAADEEDFFGTEGWTHRLWG